LNSSAIYFGLFSIRLIMATQITDDMRPRLARGVRLQTDGKTGRGVLLFPEGLLELNATAREILDRCDGRSLGEMSAELAKEYDVNPSTLAQDIRETLVELQQRNLIVFA
jgi:pyrroloquinoline quinone biosynthesis protein D